MNPLYNNMPSVGPSMMQSADQTSSMFAVPKRNDNTTLISGNQSFHQPITMAPYTGPNYTKNNPTSYMTQG
jgi:hypothetical protein